MRSELRTHLLRKANRYNLLIINSAECRQTKYRLRCSGDRKITYFD